MKQTKKIGVYYGKRDKFVSSGWRREEDEVEERGVRKKLGVYGLGVKKTGGVSVNRVLEDGGIGRMGIVKVGRAGSMKPYRYEGDGRVAVLLSPRGEEKDGGLGAKKVEGERKGEESVSIESARGEEVMKVGVEERVELPKEMESTGEGGARADEVETIGVIGDEGAREETEVLPLIALEEEEGSRRRKRRRGKKNRKVVDGGSGIVG